MTSQDLEDLIAQGIKCDTISIEGDGRHWFATIVSEEFEGLRSIKRHQLVYKTLGQKMHTDEVHALSMKTFTPIEWAQESNKSAGA
jgi:acid stress-induced BolA-like protein IbaG/YrbA